MTGKELKKLSRAELLELLLEQTKEVERLREELQRAKRLLRNRRIRIQEAGDLAHAVLDINGVMESAQAAAQQYLDNIADMEERTRIRCEQMIEEAQQEAQRICDEASGFTYYEDLENMPE